MQLTLSDKEAQDLINLIDAAIGVGRLQAAQIAMPLVQKIQQAAQESEQAGQIDECTTTGN